MKSFLPFDGQLKLLETRHLRISSKTEAKEILKTENCYRLSGYFKMFTKPGTDDFVEGFSMKKLMKIYRFDEQLRTLLTEYLGKVEIASKTRIAYNLAKVTSPISYLDSSYFVNSYYHAQFMNKVYGEVKHDSNNPIIKRFEGEIIPIWAIVEALTFGTVSKMFANLKPHLKKAIAKSTDYRLKYNESVYSNNLQMVCNLRNICAHHGRLYGKRYPYNIAFSKEDTLSLTKYGLAIPTNSTGTPFCMIYALCNLMNSKYEIRRFTIRLKVIFFKYRRFIDIKKLGFVDKWDKILCKK